MSKFKVGELVRCVEDFASGGGLTHSRLYKVIAGSYTGYDGDVVWVITDKGREDWFRASRFVSETTPEDVFTPERVERSLSTPFAARTFATGATRDTDDGKLDYEAFLSPLVLERYAQYMHGKRQIKGAPLRAGDNWQRGIPLDVYMKSGWRHFMDVWKEHRGIETEEGIEDALCAVLFNVSGYLHERLKAKCAT